MKPVMLCICMILSIYLPNEGKLQGSFGKLYSIITTQDTSQVCIEVPELIVKEIQNQVIDDGKTGHKEAVGKQNISEMEALDLVKELYAANFTKVYDDDEEEYYYKLSFADYYLVYEGKGETEKDYLIHLYEFVIDEPEEGIGHTVTYGWFMVDSETGKIKEQMQ